VASGVDVPVYHGTLRVPGSEPAPGSVTLDAMAAILAPERGAVRTIAYRDLAVLAITDGVGLVATGPGPDDERWLLERFGAATGPLIAGLRERRLRQRLEDALVDLPPGEPVDLVEYEANGPAPAAPAASERGVAQLAVDAWGATLAPLVERLPARRIRRAEIAAVEVEPAVGGVSVTVDGGSVRLLRLGPAAARHRDRFVELRAAADRDAGAAIAALAPAQPPGPAGRAAGLLVDGRPASPDDLGDAWGPLERAVLVDPTFAASFHALRERAGGADATRWLALAPERPGRPETRRAWFFVALPGNLVALEVVTGGAHATYCFRTVARADYAGDAAHRDVDAAAAAAAVRAISAALVDARFLREPMALPEEQLAQPDNLRYRLALRAIPSLAAARARFVARLVHRTEASWAAALDDLIAWHATCRDDAAPWPGRSAQEAQVAEAGGGAG
jgi:hypothetical protein